MLPLRIIALTACSFYLAGLIGTLAQPTPPAAGLSLAPAPVPALAYRPDGQLLAVASGRQVVLVHPLTGQILDRFAPDDDRVSALAFSPEGKRLLVATGLPGKDGRFRQYPVPDPVRPGAFATAPTPAPVAAHTDSILAAAYSPDGKQIATGGYDRLVKLWNAQTADLLHTLNEHSDTVYALVFSPDSQYLATAGADRAIKYWQTLTGRRLFTLADATDWLYTLAFAPDGKHLAAAGADRSIRLWQVTPEGGKLLASAFAHEKAVLRLAYSHDGKSLFSLGEDRTLKIWDTAKLSERRVLPAQTETVLTFAVRPTDSAQLALGLYDGRLSLLEASTGQPQSTPLPELPGHPNAKQHHETPNNDSPTRATPITHPAVVVGALSKPGEVDWFRFHAKAGQPVGVQLVGAGPNLTPWLRLVSLAQPLATPLAEGTDTLAFTAPADGEYALAVQDRDFRGTPDTTYRLTIGPVRVITGVYTLSVQRGTTAEVSVRGVHLGKQQTVRVSVPATAAPGTRQPLPGLPASVAVGEFPDHHAQPGPSAGTLPIPGTGHGILTDAQPQHSWRFTAKKGQRLIVETLADRLGSPLDSEIDILDAQGQPIVQAVLRCQTQTYTTFRDHDSTSGGIRIEAWNELAIDDFVYVGNTLLKIKALPRNPDDDCQFYTEQGRRKGWLGTTPTHHPQGEPMYKVTLHPPGSTFPPNGLPVFTITYRNDDGGAGLGKDSRLFFDPPADGEYTVRVRDARGAASPLHAYALTIRPPRPDFRISINPTAPQVWRGGAIPITATVTRLDGFDGPVQLQLRDLPDGFAAPATFIEAGQESTAFALTHTPTADPPPPTKTNPQLIAKAVIDGQEVTRTVALQAPKLLDHPDISTRTAEKVITIKPGHEARFRVHIERHGSFAGRVPLEVQGLPHGVRVLNVGLNGILITPEETSRVIILYAEPWVQPMTHPLVVFARREGTPHQFAAPSVQLRVQP
jgi:WD40 repeat protein